MEKEDLLYRYFHGTLSEEELVIFNKLLEEDNEFNEQFRFEKDVQQVIKDKERSQLKKKLQGFETQLGRPPAQKPNFWKPLRIAASIAVLLAAGWYFYSTGMSADPEKLYAANYEIYPNTVYSITRGDATDTTLERKAFEAYETEDHKTAIGYFEELGEKSGLDYIDFYLAQSYLAHGDTQKGLQLFEKIISEKTDFKTESLWYASLANLRIGNEEKAVEQLKALIADGSYKRAEAQDLLHRLD